MKFQVAEPTDDPDASADTGDAVTSSRSNGRHRRTSARAQAEAERIHRLVTRLNRLIKRAARLGLATRLGYIGGPFGSRSTLDVQTILDAGGPADAETARAEFARTREIIQAAALTPWLGPRRSLRLLMEPAMASEAPEGND